MLTACARARSGEEGPESGGGVMATGDSYGRVRLTQFPARRDAAQLEWRGHAGTIAALAFDADETHLLTAGRDDRCVMQWVLVEDEREADDADNKDEDEAEDYAPELRDQDDFKRLLDIENVVDIISERLTGSEVHSELFESSETVIAGKRGSRHARNL